MQVLIRKYFDSVLIYKIVIPTFLDLVNFSYHLCPNDICNLVEFLRFTFFRIKSNIS